MESKLRPVTILLLLAACAFAVCACTPANYARVRVYDWARADIDQRFPIGTDKKTVFKTLGEPLAESSIAGLARWQYSRKDRKRAGNVPSIDSASIERSVGFVFKGDFLVDKEFENF